MISKTKFDRFYSKLFGFLTFEGQIISLKLSNSTNTCNQIYWFLAFGSLKYLRKLESLTMLEVKPTNFEDILSALPSLKKLRHFSFHTKYQMGSSLLTALPSLAIEKLSIPQLYSDPPSNKICLVKHLTVSVICILERLFDYFKCAPMLKYLSINELKSDEIIVNPTQAICLTTLIIREMEKPQFSKLEIIFKNTPNLKKLILSTKQSINILDASHWQHLISSLLPHLNIFKFNFRVQFRRYNETTLTNEEIFGKYLEFQNDFWHQQHQWHTVYESNDDCAIISTIPYYSDEFTLKSSTQISSKQLINNRDIFKKVTHLNLHQRAFNNCADQYFSNIEFLTLAYPAFDIQDLESMRNIIDLPKLKFLGIEKGHTLDSPSIILEILKQAPNIRAIAIPTEVFLSFFDNNDLCFYLNRIIKKLTITTNYMFPYRLGFIDTHKIPQFCEIFSNLGHLQCSIHKWDDFINIWSQLPKLARITITSQLTPPDGIDLYEKVRSISSINFLYDYDTTGAVSQFLSPATPVYNALFIWTRENQKLIIITYFTFVNTIIKRKNK
ncbi:unnamed protein product [Adineta steineri]|uniref:Uncharacterized protein n=1 Tax=Adineta steineri TaxID=433720 RepID=A0A815N514_9BILA|nr:unnamed protein product [Adineta steineri]CAF3984834.1 unnamed protein product [Adineta steineri]